MHQRSEKNSHLDTILYEIDMFVHCGDAIGQKKADAEKSDFARAEYFLAIEGFLLHLRNLLAFFTNRKDEQTDLIINEPLVWASRDIEQVKYSAIIKRWKEFDKKYGASEDDRPSSCYKEISKFLQHCTTFRYERAKRWPIEEMYADAKPMLADFGAGFAPKAERVERILGSIDYTTATFRKSG
jgi:hypothetical protein